MAERAAATDDNANGAHPPDGLESRVRRLEDAVAALQDTRDLEERVVQRVGDRVRRDSRGGRDTASLLVSASRQLLPAAVDVLRPPAAVERPALPPPPSGLRGPRFVLDAFAELRAIIRMYMDPRHRLSWTAYVVPFALVSLIATSWIWLPGTALLPGTVGTLVMKAVDLILAFVLYKFLSREARWYRDQGYTGSVVRGFLARFLRVRLVVVDQEARDPYHDPVRR
jgi:hypothetical protein